MQLKSQPDYVPYGTLNSTNSKPQLSSVGEQLLERAQTAATSTRVLVLLTFAASTPAPPLSVHFF